MSRKTRKSKHLRLPGQEISLEEGIRPGEQISLTSALLKPLAHVELSGNQEALVEGCTGIIEYNNNTIRLNTEKFILRFSGRNLQISCMTEQSIIIKGFILSVEYLN